MTVRRFGLFSVLALAAGCSDYNLNGDKDSNPGGVDETEGTDVEIIVTTCELDQPEPLQVGTTEDCKFDIGGFEPVVAWTGGDGKSSRATVAVADLDGDDKPEIIANITAGILPGKNKGVITVYHGHTGKLAWEADAQLGYASALAVGDLDVDGVPEIVGVKEIKNSTIGKGEYAVVCYDNEGTLLWESEHFEGDDFDYATSPILADLDADGDPEIVAGRVILRSDGTTRGIGEWGRGSWGTIKLGGATLDEAAVPAVADLDLDGQQEVIVGNAMYDADGNTLWHDPGQADGMIGIANLDNDDAGEFVVSSFNTVRAVDTDGTLLWGPKTIETANIVSPPAIADLDRDGRVDVVVAGGNVLRAYKWNGDVLWDVQVEDMSGASGASIFDFEGDGYVEVVYMDEIQVIAVDGETGAIKFWSDQHGSDTMMDYPVIADVDADGHAEVIVAHANWGNAFSVYEDAADSWAPARGLWNQHAYSIGNINDDLTIPTGAIQSFSMFNTWHSAVGSSQGALKDDLMGEILQVCEADCGSEKAVVTGRLHNRSEQEMPAGISVALYARIDGHRVLADRRMTTAATASGTAGELIEFVIESEMLMEADSLVLSVDDGGNGGGFIPECAENNNSVEMDGPFCQD